jgi:hypothetical protein
MSGQWIKMRLVRGHTVNVVVKMKLEQRGIASTLEGGGSLMQYIMLIE